MYKRVDFSKAPIFWIPILSFEILTRDHERNLCKIASHHNSACAWMQRQTKRYLSVVARSFRFLGNVRHCSRVLRQVFVQNDAAKLNIFFL